MKSAKMPQDHDWDHFWSLKKTDRFTNISWSKRRIMRVLAEYVAPGRTALDAGCGSGFFSRYFCENGMAVTALDYSQQALQLAKEQTQGKARLLQADLLSDPLQELVEARCDLIFTDGLLEHFSTDEQSKILQNFISVLSEDGCIITFVPNRWSPWELIRPVFMPGIEEEPFQFYQLVDLNQRNGLRVVEKGGINTLPFRWSPDRLVGPAFGMLLYTVATLSPETS